MFYFFNRDKSMSEKPRVRFKGKIFTEVEPFSLEELKALFEGNAEDVKKLALKAFESLLENVLFISVVEYEGKKFVRKVCIRPADSLSLPLTPEEQTIIHKYQKEAREDSASDEEWDSFSEEMKMIFTLYSGKIFNRGEGDRNTFSVLCQYLFHYLESGEFFNTVLMYNELEASSNPDQPGKETIFFMPLHITKE